MTYLAGGQKFRHSVKLKVFPGQWLKAKQRLKVKTTDDEFINGYLDNLEGIIKEAQTHSLLSNNEIDFSFVKQKFNDALGKKEEKRNFFVIESSSNNLFSAFVNLLISGCPGLKVPMTKVFMTGISMGNNLFENRWGIIMAMAD